MKMSEIEDPLGLVIFLSVHIFKITAARTILIFTLTTHIIVQFIQIYYYAFVFTTEDCIKYSPGFFGIFYGILGVALILFFEPGEVEILSVEYGHVQNENFGKVKKFVLGHMSLAVLTGIAFAIPIKEDEEIFFAYRLFNEWFGANKIYFNTVYRLTMMVFSYTMVSHEFQLIYVGTHEKSYVTWFCQFLESGVLNLKDDYKYQKKVKDVLRFFVDRHVRIFQCSRKMANILSGLIFPFLISGSLVLISTILYGFYHTAPPQDKFLRIILLFINGSISCSVFMLAGQWHIDKMMEISTTLLRIEWYKFDCRNKKILLLCIANAEKMPEYKISDGYRLDFCLGLRFARAIYSVFSVFLRLNKGG